MGIVLFGQYPPKGCPLEGRKEGASGSPSGALRRGLTRCLVAHPEPPHAVGRTRNSRLNGSRIQAGKRASDKRYTEQFCHSRLLKHCIVLSYNAHGEGPLIHIRHGGGQRRDPSTPHLRSQLCDHCLRGCVMFRRPIFVLSAVTTLFICAAVDRATPLGGLPDFESRKVQSSTHYKTTQSVWVGDSSHSRIAPPSLARGFPQASARMVDLVYYTRFGIRA